MLGSGLRNGARNGVRNGARSSVRLVKSRFRCLVAQTSTLKCVALTSKSEWTHQSIRLYSTADGVKEADSENVPWYLRPEESSTSDEYQKPMPELPEQCPDTLERIVELMHNKLGITDISIFDKRDQELEDVGMDLAKDFILIGTGKSDRHLQKATQELMGYIKHELGNEKLPRVEGFSKVSSILKKERKLRRKLKKNTGYHFEDYGVPMNSWIMVDCDHNVGNMSIHFITQERREALNLELLWCNPEDKHLYKRVRKPLINDSIFAGLRRFHSLNQPRFPSVTDFITRNYSTTTAFGVLSATLDNLRNMKLVDAETVVLQDKFVPDFINLLPETPTSKSLDLEFQFYKTLHQISPEKYEFEQLDQLLLKKVANSLVDITTDDLIEYIVLLMESPKFSRNESIDKLSQLVSIVEPNETLFKDWEVEILPYVLAMMSNFNNPNFVKPRDVLDNINHFDKFGYNETKFSVKPHVYGIFEFLNSRNYPFLDSDKSQMLLVTFLTIFGNSHNYNKFYEALDQVYNPASMTPDRRPWEFVISYIYKTGSLKQYSYFIDTIYPQISIYNEFSDLFMRYLQRMKDDLNLEKIVEIN